MRRYVALLVLAYTSLLAACDHGLAPPPPPLTGAIEVEVTYLNHETTWPPSLFDLRFVAMPFIPQDTSDFLQLERLVISDGLEKRTPRARETVFLPSVKAGTYVYSGIAEQYSSDIFAWRPVGLYVDNGGVFEVRESETTHLTVTVDFVNRPPFPPP